MFMNLTVHYTKRFIIQNISSPVHNLYLDSTTMIVILVAFIFVEAFAC